MAWCLAEVCGGHTERLPVPHRDIDDFLVRVFREFTNDSSRRMDDASVFFVSANGSRRVADDSGNAIAAGQVRESVQPHRRPAAVESPRRLSSRCVTNTAFRQDGRRMELTPDRIIAEHKRPAKPVATLVPYREVILTVESCGRITNNGAPQLGFSTSIRLFRYSTEADRRHAVVTAS